MSLAVACLCVGLQLVTAQVVEDVQNDFLVDYGSSGIEIGREIVSGMAGILSWPISGPDNGSGELPFLYSNSVERDVHVETTHGTVAGFASRTSRMLKEYMGFVGIPYAAPPVGDRRFREPVEPEPWRGVRDARYERPTCLSFTPRLEKSTMNEDCLYLNVFTPAIKSGDAKAVMVFIHGGAFIGGSSSSRFYSPDFFMDQDVLLVTFNYRLGPLGFLSLQNKDVPGNAGLKDQAMAMKWVRRNIGRFGGDDKRVTIFGESAGAASVHYHVLSRRSAGLFDQAIMQSGCVLSPWAHRNGSDAERIAKALGTKVGCSAQDNGQLAKCLRQVPAQDLVLNQEKILSTQEIISLNPIAFTPTTEPKRKSSFIDDDPSDMLHSGDFNKVPMIIGTNSAEGLLLLPPLKKFDPLGLLVTSAGAELQHFIPRYVREKCTPEEERQVVNLIKTFYFQNQPPTVVTRRKVLDFFTDVEFLIPAQRATTLMARRSSNIYNYWFTYDGPYGLYKTTTGIQDEPGVSHADELGYLFCAMVLRPQYGGHKNRKSRQEEMVDDISRLWADFAKTGNPTPISRKWEPYNDDGYKFYEIGENQIPGRNVQKNHVRFWSDIYKMVAGNKSKSFPE